MGFVQLPGSRAVGGITEVNTAGWPHCADWSSIYSSLIKCCMRQTEQISLSLVRLIRVANGMVYS